MQNIKLPGSAPVSAATVKVHLLIGHNYHSVLSYGFREQMISLVEDLKAISITETIVLAARGET